MATFSEEAEKWLWEKKSSRCNSSPWCQLPGISVCSGKKLGPRRTCSSWSGCGTVGFRFPGTAQISGSQDMLWPVPWVVLATPGLAPHEEGEDSNAVSQEAGYPTFGFSRLHVFPIPLFSPSPSTLLLLICSAFCGESRGKLWEREGLVQWI